MGLLATVIFVFIFTLSNCEEDNLQTTYQESLSTAVAHFTQSIYVHLAKTSDEENFVFSPLSLHSALSLLYLATKDNSTTQDQLGAAMGIINSHNLLKTAYQEMIQKYRNQRSFLYGNKIWIGRDFDVDQEYKDVVESNFDSEISNIDFGRREAVDEVNNWIRKTTNNKIKNLVDSFSADTQMFLANALYFKESWLIPFKELDFNGDLIERDFKTDSGKCKVPMVWQESDQFGYGEIKTLSGVLEVVTIPYGNENFEMQIIIPEDNKHFSIVENMMELEKERDKVGDNFNLFKKPKNESENTYDEIQLVFPKFIVKSKFNAAEAMKTLGATEMFTSGAELDKITAGGPIGVGNILHEAVVEVTKDGTEGSAATGVEITLYSAGFQKHILVDRPFIFIIQDKVNNIPILVGRIKNPTIQLP
jgi:serine protease inhibitor